MATQLNDWLSISQTSGSGDATITLTASSYNELVDRATSLSIKTEGKEVLLNIHQKAFVPPSRNDYFWVKLEEDGDIYGFEDRTTFQHSLDLINWYPCPATLSVPADTYVWFRNTSSVCDISLSTVCRASVGGDLSSMGSMIEYNFRYFLSSNPYLTDASELILPWTTLAKECYTGMFSGCYWLTTAPELPATTLAKSCYAGMFYGCANLTTAPELPSTELADYCYGQMFRECTNLTTAPQLPATTLADGCYSQMFSDCTALTTAPELPATTLAKECYYWMFYGCTSLTTAPALPATELAVSCYEWMFQGCSSLTTAPELPATTLMTKCYNRMFYRCNKLNYIKMLATTDIGDGNYLGGWTEGVANEGTFVKHPDASIPSGTSGIPEGWTIETATS